MTNTELLKAKISESGVSAAHIYRKLGISATAFYNKLNNDTQFKPTEISIICGILHIEKKKKERIFFAK